MERELLDKAVADGTSWTVSVKFVKKTNVAVYIYGGADRRTSITPLVLGNQQPTINLEYKASADSGGILIVAYPSQQDAATELEFEYWVAEGVFEGAKEGETDPNDQEKTD